MKKIENSKNKKDSVKIKENINIKKEEKIINEKREKNRIDKKYKVLKFILIMALSVIIIELLIMLILYFKNENNINYMDTINNVKLIDNKYYLGAGSSNFRYSKYNDKKVYEYHDSITDTDKRIIAEQAKLVKYDNDMNIVWEKTFDTKYDSTYYDATLVSDGIIAVGSYIYDYEQIEARVRDGLIVKYDSEGNFKWFKNYQILGDTEFYKVINVSDGIIAIGQSIYENMELGNHTNGGGIIVKLDYDGNIIWANNFGGNKSGSFNDIVVVNDGYIVCGKDGANYGLIAKFSKNGELKWHYSTYELAVTDSYGFNAMKLHNNKLYIASSINYSDEKNDKGEPIYKFKGCIFVYDLNGKCINRYRSDKVESFTNLITSTEGITAIGYTTDLENKKYANQTSSIVKFNYDGKESISEYYGGLNNDILTTIIDNNYAYLTFGYSNSFGNKKDYKVVYIDISKRENTIFELND